MTYTAGMGATLHNLMGYRYLERPLPRLLALALASGLTASLALMGIPTVFAALLAMSWAILGGLVLGPCGIIAAFIPVLALVPAIALTPVMSWNPGASIWSLTGFTAAGGSTAIAWHLITQAYWRHDTRDLRHQLRQSGHEQRHLADSIGRYPALQEASLALAGVRDMDHLAEVLCQQVRAVVPSTFVTQVHLGVAAQLSCRASADSEGHPVPTEPTEDEKYVATEARILTRRAPEHIRVMLPLRGERRGSHNREALCGVLVVALPNDVHDEQLHVELLIALAQLGGIGLAAVDLVSQARALALRDDLTGLFGQHEFLRRLDEQVAAARRHSQPLGVVMCDLDHLKRFNDTWGHAAGDDALKAVAQAIRTVISAIPGGIACRYGGEEFALCLPGCANETLRAVAEHLRRDIAATIPDPLHAQRRVTASFGIATLRPSENGRAVLIRADAAAYRAKAAGRNCVAAADDMGSVEAASRILPIVVQDRGRSASAQHQKITGAS